MQTLKVIFKFLYVSFRFFLYLAIEASKFIYRWIIYLTTEWTEIFKRRNRNGKIAMGCGTLMVACFGLSLLTIPFSDSSVESREIAQIASVDNSSLNEADIRPTERSVMTRTPMPTLLNTPEPEPTSDLTTAEKSDPEIDSFQPVTTSISPLSATEPSPTTQAAEPTQIPTKPATATPLPSPTPATEPNLIDLPTGEPAELLRIIDGDTIEVLVAGEVQRVRYIGIDTPESNDLCGSEATEANRKLLEGQPLILVKDKSETDRFDRLLRYVYTNNQFVNAQLVAQGWAEAIRYPPDTAKATEFEELMSSAKANNLGCHPVGAFIDNPILAAPSLQISASSANLRAGPGTQYPTVGNAFSSETYEIIASNNDQTWYQVRLANNETAWIASSVSVVAANSEPITVAAIIPPAPTLEPTKIPQPAAAPIPTLAPPTVAPIQPEPTLAPQPTAAVVAASPGKIIISYIFYDGVEKQYEGDEYVEMKNTGGEAVNLSGWRINAGDPSQDYYFGGMSLGPGQSCRIYTDIGFGDNCEGRSYGSPNKAIWNNKGDCGYLYNASGAEVDKYCY